MKRNRIFIAAAGSLVAALSTIAVADEITPTDPSAEKLALATEVASYSALATIGPLQTAAEVEDIIASNPDLTTEEQDRLRAIGRARAETLARDALAAEAAALAELLSLEDLRAIAEFERLPAAANQRAATPQVAMRVMQGLQGLDYKGEVKAAFCAETGKLCEGP